MRKLISLFIGILGITSISLFSPNSQAKANELNFANPTFEINLAEKAKTQSDIIDEILSYYKAEGYSEEEILTSGVDGAGIFYFSDDGQSIIFKKEKFSDQRVNNNSVVDKIIEKSKRKFGQNKVVVQETIHSLRDLNKLLEDIKKEKENLNIKNSGVNILPDQDKVEIIAPHISEQQKEELKGKFGDSLVITVDNNYTQKDYKTRRDDWNKMGAGLGIKYRNSDGDSRLCSTGGVVTKGSTYYVLTAGHCTVDASSPIYQWNGQLGVRHPNFNSIPSGFDVGLIIPSNSSLSRYAYNGLLMNTALGSVSDYGGNIKSTRGYTVLNQTVCKTGATTGYTCGKVTKVGHTLPSGLVVSIAEKEPSQGFLAGSGDSGGAVTDANNYFTGLVQGGSPAVQDENGSYYGYNMFFTRWGDFGPRYDLNFYTSSSQTLMPN